MPRRNAAPDPPISTPASATDNAIPMPHTFRDGLALPKVLVFDLDYTLWPFWCDTHLSPPLKPHTSTSVKDRYGGTYAFYPEVPSVLLAARQVGIKVAAASRTHTPDIAMKLLRLLHVPEAGTSGRSAVEYFDDLQIYPGDKVAHVTRISKALPAGNLTSSASTAAAVVTASGSARRGKKDSVLPVAAGEGCMPYGEMLFFDDEQRNANTERERGVCFWLIRDGVSRDEIDKGVWKWRKARGIESPSQTGSSDVSAKEEL